MAKKHLFDPLECVYVAHVKIIQLPGTSLPLISLLPIQAPADTIKLGTHTVDRKALRYGDLKLKSCF